MAAQNPIATIWNRIRHPVDTIRSNISQGASEWRAHPIQETLQRLIGFGTGALTANPVAGSAAGSAADRLFNWWNNRGNNDFGPASGMSGITSPYTGSQSQMGAALGIPDYLSGSIPQGQTEQAQTDPNEHPSQLRPSDATVTPFGPQTPAQPANYDTGWRTGEGGSGLGSGWSTVSGNALRSILSSAGSSGTGSLAGNGSRVGFRMTPEFGTELTGPDGQTRTRGGDSRLIQKSPLAGPTTASDWIRKNPEQWAQMQQNMRSRS